MRPLLIVDVETSGTDPAKDHLVEVAGALFDVEDGCLVAAKSAPMHAESNAAAHVNRIPESLLRRWSGFGDAAAFYRGIAAVAPEPPIYVAHNAAFDRQWLPGVGEEWICTMEQGEWPRPCESRSLTAIALAHDVGVVHAHRAIADVLTLAAILTRVHEIEGGLQPWLDRALEPRVEVIAQVSYDDRDLAKRAGFGWDAERKLWTKRVRQSVANDFAERLAFRVRVAA